MIHSFVIAAGDERVLEVPLFESRAIASRSGTGSVGQLTLLAISSFQLLENLTKGLI
jgi:hypothetical protein